MASQTTQETKKRLALSIIDFLTTSTKDGTLSTENAENIEVATSCIADAFNVDPSNKAAVSDAVGLQSLCNIFSVYEKMQGRSSTAGSTPAASTTASTATSSTPNPEAEKLKSAGNAAMQQKDYKTAIDKYTAAIAMSPTNPIYLSNRAAAYSASQDHAAAAADAEIAVAADPKYTKAWSRLGLAKFAMGDARGSMEAYQKGIEYEGNGGSEAMKKGLQTAKNEVSKMEVQEEDIPSEAVDEGTRSAPTGGMPDLASMASMFGGGAGGGGMPDLSSIMSNPMFASMAQNLMSNPGALQGLMQNPMVQGLMNQRREGGGGMPDMSQIQQMMQDPNISQMAQQFMGGMGRGAGGAAGGAGADAGAGAGAGRGAGA